MGKSYVTLKIEEDTYKKFKQAKRLREFSMDEGLTITEFFETMLESEFRKHDGKTIQKVK